MMKKTELQRTKGDRKWLQKVTEEYVVDKDFYFIFIAIIIHQV